MDMGDIFKKVLLTGVGAVATTVEAAQDLVDTLVKKGEITVEQGKVLNEELMRDMKEKAKDKIKDRVTINIVRETMDVESLSKEEREALKAKLDELEKEEAQKAQEAAKEECNCEDSSEEACDCDCDCKDKADPAEATADTKEEDSNSEA